MKLNWKPFIIFHKYHSDGVFFGLLMGGGPDDWSVTLSFYRWYLNIGIKRTCR